MISVISATNRPNNKTNIIAEAYINALNTHYDGLILNFSLEDLPIGVLNETMYEASGQDSSLRKIQEKYFIGPEKWVLLLPEYNGGIPGVFKLLLDCMSVHKYSDTFENKKICLVGISSGRAGNLRGLDYITNVFHYLKSNIYPIKMPISNIEKLLDIDKGLADSHTISEINRHVVGFTQY